MGGTYNTDSYELKKNKDETIDKRELPYGGTKEGEIEGEIELLKTVEEITAIIEKKY